MRVDFEHEALSGKYISHNSVQWKIGKFSYVTGANLKYIFRNAGIFEVQVYIATSEGNVVSRGNVAGMRSPVSLTARNFLGTDIKVTPQSGFGEIEPAVATLTDTTGTTSSTTLGTTIHLTAGEVSMPLDIYSQHSWQLYDETPTPYVVSLYADEAGLDYSIENIQGTDSIPLVTPAYLNNKYAQYQKTWRFSTDLAGSNPVGSITTTTTKLYAKKNDSNSGFEFCPGQDTAAEFCGTSGSDIVYYHDDSPAYFTPSGDGPYLYRLWFELDTTRWPDRLSVEWLDTAEIKDSETYIDTPQVIQSSQDFLFTNVHPATAANLIFTSAGISSPGFEMSKIKFQHTEIPFVLSLGSATGSIIKDNNTDYMPASGIEVIVPWVRPAAPVDNIIYIGCSSTSSTMSPSDISIIQNPVFSDKNIPQYSSASYILSSTKPYDNVSMHGLIVSSTGELTGDSTEFDILPATGKYVFFRHGEEIDYGGIMNGYILQENINRHDRLGNTVNAIFGTGNSLPSSPGKIIHEKIHNFTGNNIDLDVCNVPAIYSLADSTGFTPANYDFSYPGGIRRLVDVLSIGISKMIGGRDRYSDDFTDEALMTSTGNVEYGRNIGKSPLDIDTYTVSAGSPIVVKELWDNNIFKVIPSYISGDSTDPHYTMFQNINGLSSYPLKEYDDSRNWGLTYPSTNIFSDYYEFYEYIDNSTYPVSSFDQSHGVINWEDTNKLGRAVSTLSETATGYGEWFDQYGIADTMIEWSLRNGLEHIDNI